MQRPQLDQAALDKAQRINDALSMRGQLSDSLAKSVVEALETWLQVAASPGHPHYAVARHWVGRLDSALEGARAVSAGLQVATRIPGGGNGRP